MRIKIIKNRSNAWYRNYMYCQYDIIGIKKMNIVFFKVIEKNEDGIMLVDIRDCEVIDFSPRKFRHRVVNFIDEIRWLITGSLERMKQIIVK